MEEDSNYENLIFIPARRGSKRIKNKNIQKINNKTLIKIAIDKALNILEKKTKIVLSTDFKEEELGLSETLLEKISIHHRTQSVSHSTSSTESTLSEFLDKEKHYFQKSNGYVLLMQVTSPLLSVNSLENGLSLYKEKSIQDFLTVFSVYEYKQFTWNFENGNFKPFSYDPFNRKPTQEIQSSFNETGGFYIFPIKGFFHFRNRFMNNSLPSRVNLFESLDIDEISDLELARKVHII